MTESYHRTPQHDESRPQLLRPMLWVLLTIGVVGNAVASAIGAGIALHVGVGAVTAVCAVALLAQYFRRR